MCYTGKKGTDLFFLVAKGQARFRFRQILTDETYTIETRSEQPTIVETIPGLAHDIGDEEMVVMLWANEIFDRERPDTVACAVEVVGKIGARL